MVMKRAFIALLISLNCVSVQSQQITPGTTMTKDDYLQKSRSQKTAAWIMLGGGALATTAGIIWFSQEFTLFGPTSSEESASGAIVVVGVAAMGGSIPLFIASARNKRKANAMALLITAEDLSRTASLNFKTSSRYPALTFRITLK